MNIELMEYTSDDVQEICNIWNQVILDGDGFLWEEVFPLGKIEYVLGQQLIVICARDIDTDMVVGFYTLRKNQSGRGSHVGNGLYAVHSDFRCNGIGKMLGQHSLEQAKKFGFNALQFNSVISSNVASIKTWESIGFERVGVVEDGYRSAVDKYCDLYIYYKVLSD